MAAPVSGAPAVPKLELRGLSKTFRDGSVPLPALAEVSLIVQPGEFVTLIGPSGSGKSTLFNIIVGLTEPDAGTILFDGEPPARGGRPRAAYMPQRDLLLPWRTVLENVILPLEVAGRPRPEARARARELLPLFGLEAFADAYPAALSGGLRQRAALLRTLLTDRDVLLLDEPFGALDALTRRELQDWLLDLWGRFRPTVLLITHDVEEALYLGDRVVVLSARPARVALTLDVRLPRPRRRGLITLPEFGRQEAELLQALGVPI